MRVHLISDIGDRPEPELRDLLLAVREGNPDFFQVREKTLSDRRLADLTKQVRAGLPKSTAVLVNGRPDIAMASGAQGVQLPSDGLPAAEIRKAFPSPFLIGVSCHSLAEVLHAADDGADFALLSPIYPPKSKLSAFPALGPEIFDGLPERLPIQVYALGGIDAGRVASWPESRRQRVAGVAGVSLLAASHGRGSLEELRRIPGACETSTA